MTLQLDTATRTNMASQIATALAGGSVKVFSGAVPANCAAADPAGPLGAGTLPSPALTASAGGDAISGTWTVTGTNAGTIASFRAYDSTAVCRAQGTVGWTASNGAWAAIAYAVGNTVSAGGNVYRLTATGTGSAVSAPTGVTTYTDANGWAWAYVGPVGDMNMDNTAISTGQVLSVTAFTLTMPGA